MSIVFIDARSKIQRANKHIGDLKCAVLTLKQSKRAIVQINPHTGHQELIHTLEFPSPASDDISLIAGDAIHNLKSALDFAWQSVLKTHAPALCTNRSKFPVYQTRDALIGALNGIHINPSSQSVIYNAIVSDIQPYEGGKLASAIYILHELDIADKHLLVLGLRPLAGIEGIVVEDENGETIHGFGATTEAPPPYVIPFERNFRIKDKGKLAFDIVLPESSLYEFVEITEVLSKLSQVVLHCVELLENP